MVTGRLSRLFRLANRRGGLPAAVGLAGSAALALAGCLEDPPPPKPLPELEVFGTGDTMVYIGDTARFSVRTVPSNVAVTGYAWTFSREEGRYDPVQYDSAETTGPFLTRVFRAEEAGRHSIGVELLGVTGSWWHIQPPGFSFPVRVDPGRPGLTLDSESELPFGPGNRLRAKAQDPNGRVEKYHWSTTYGTFTDSTDIPEWTLSDSLLGYQDIYCRARDEDGQFSDTVRKSVRFTPRGLYGSVRDHFAGVNALPGGGFLAAGQTQSFDTRRGDAWLARLDAEGRLIAHATVKRSHVFGTDGTGWFNALAPGEPGSHLAVGAYRDSTHNEGFFAVADAQGKVLTQGFEEGAGQQEYQAAAWLQSGLWVAVGNSVTRVGQQDTSSGLLSFIRPDGTHASRKVSRGRSLSFHCVAPTADGNVLAGATGAVNFTAQGGFLYKATPAGDTLWSRPVDPGGFPLLIPHALIACKAGGFAMLGFAYDGALIHRLDAEGKVQWTRVISKVPGEWPRAGSLVEIPDGDILAAVDLPYKANPNSGLLFTRLDAQGTIKWSRRLGRADDGVEAVAAVQGAGIAAVGSLSNSAWLLRLGEDGKVLW